MFSVAIFLIFGLFASSNAAGCSIDLTSDIPTSEPLYLVKSGQAYTFFEPTGRVTNLPVNAVLTLYCPGKKNSLSDSSLESMELTCNKKGAFEDSKGNVRALSEIGCLNDASASIISTQTKCANGKGTIYLIGWPFGDQFLTLIEACYQDSSASALYSKHSINGHAIEFSIKEPKRPDFSWAGLPRNVKPAYAYKKKSQVERFSAVLGTNQEYFTTGASFLSRGHLAPDADFIFRTGQWGTYFFANVCPQFQDANAGNWLRVESLTRQCASRLDAKPTIYTGTYDQLSLDGQGLWLDNNLINIPKWTWKVVMNDDSAIVFITSNNPHATKADVVEICPNVCEKANINAQTRNAFTNLNKGYTYCCELSTFKKVVGTFPTNISAKTLLECP